MALIVSVIIPVKNGEETLEVCLNAIFSQKFDGKLEVIIIDSGSTDGSIELLSKYPLTIHKILPDEFNHGDTRNLGVKLARGKFVVMTVQDAIPADDHWIDRMLNCFSDKRVAGVCGSQIVPHDIDKNPIQWYRPVSTPGRRLVFYENSNDFDSLSPGQKLADCRWDDVTTMYKRSVLLEIPFQRVNFAEDTLWAKEALEKGHALVYNNQAQVHHYHNEDFQFSFRRNYTILYHWYKFFNFTKSPGSLIIGLIRCGYVLAKESFSFDIKLKWFNYNIKIIFAQWLSGYIFCFSSWLLGKNWVEKSHRYFCSKPPQSTKA